MHALVSALDWGLGHTTRLIPILKNLSNKGFQLTIVSTPIQREVYTKFFPQAIFINCSPLKISYGKGKNQIFSFARLIPHLFIHLARDKKLVKKLTKTGDYKLIVSDNRYGFYAKTITSILITHQLKLITPINWPLFNHVINCLYKRLLKPFDEIWIPSMPPPDNLSGKLSSVPTSLNRKTKHIGILSRFSVIDEIKINNYPHLDVLFIISGPEKQRTVFENIILQELKYNNQYNYLIFRGLSNNVSKIENGINSPGELEMISAIQSAKYIICRSGYSSIMDLLYLGKRALLVPTPGQSEQEYLAEYLSRKNLFPTLNQNDFQLEKAISMLNNEDFHPLPSCNTLLLDKIFGNLRSNPS
ncbi:MAG: hypothetical protein MI922_06050 [Bacteroidales bacterium]|nr:hypothetical protein [Bacteroidales bacterium]